jgi:tRNA(fMet)-specific endonuclease VapC
VNSRIVLDTNAYSELFRGNLDVLDVLASAKEILLPATVLGELLAGFKMGNRELKNRQELKSFLSKPTVKVHSVNEEVADVYATILCELRVIGRKIPTNDIWIAAHAMASGAVLITFDAHFKSVNGLRRWDLL